MLVQELFPLLKIKASLRILLLLILLPLCTKNIIESVETLHDGYVNVSAVPEEIHPRKRTTVSDAFNPVSSAMVLSL